VWRNSRCCFGKVVSSYPLIRGTVFISRRVNANNLRGRKFASCRHRPRGLWGLAPQTDCENTGKELVQTGGGAVVQWRLLVPAICSAWRKAPVRTGQGLHEWRLKAGSPVTDKAWKSDTERCPFMAPNVRDLQQASWQGKIVIVAAVHEVGRWCDFSSSLYNSSHTQPAIYF
jgi:hypothetical protein